MRSSAKLISIALARDIKNTFRIWRLNSGSTFSAHVVLTVGIGATTAIFSVLSSLLIRPLPVADANHLMRVTGVDAAGNDIRLTMPDALDVRKWLSPATDFAFYRLAVGNLADRSRPVMVHVLETDAALFNVMGVKLARGNAFGPIANQPGHACQAVISWSFWQTQFGGLPVIGKNIRLNNRPCQVNGVLPQQLDLPMPADVWIPVPFNLTDPNNGRRIQSWYGLAHLKSAAGVKAFNAQLTALCKELSREHPDEDAGLAMKAMSLRDWLSHDSRTSVLILFAAVVVVLLMACANVANLLLARSSARLREISVRVAVGASRAMLFQQLITESLLLALISSVSGLLLTIAAVHILRNLPNLPIPRPESIVVDWRVMVFAVSAAAVTGLLFGSLPALRVSVTSLTAVLSQAGAGSAKRESNKPLEKS